MIDLTIQCVHIILSTCLTCRVDNGNRENRVIDITSMRNKLMAPIKYGILDRNTIRSKAVRRTLLPECGIYGIRARSHTKTSCDGHRFFFRVIALLQVIFIDR